MGQRGQGDTGIRREEQRREGSVGRLVTGAVQWHCAHLWPQYIIPFALPVIVNTHVIVYTYATLMTQSRHIVATFCKYQVHVNQPQQRAVRHSNQNKTARCICHKYGVTHCVGRHRYSYRCIARQDPSRQRPECDTIIQSNVKP